MCAATTACAVASLLVGVVETRRSSDPLLALRLIAGLLVLLPPPPPAAVDESGLLWSDLLRASVPLFAAAAAASASAFFFFFFFFDLGMMLRIAKRSDCDMLTCIESLCDLRRTPAFFPPPPGLLFDIRAQVGPRKSWSSATCQLPFLSQWEKEYLNLESLEVMVRPIKWGCPAPTSGAREGRREC